MLCLPLIAQHVNMRDLKTDSSSKFKIHPLILIVLLLTFLSYWPSLWNGFTNWDDDTHLLRNINVWKINGENLQRIFTSDISGVYIPLTQLSFAIEYHFFKENAFVYHLDNLLLHLTVVFLMYVLGKSLGLKDAPALIASFIFGIHPIHVESVAWVTERKDVLYSVFYLLSLIYYLKYLDGKPKAYMLSIIFGLLSMLSKPMALSLPFIMFLVDWMRGRKFEKALVLDKLPHVFYIGLIGWQTYQHQLRIPGSADLMTSGLTWLWTATFYIKKFFMPFDLMPFYKLPKPIILANEAYALAIFIVFILLFCLVRFKNNRWLVFSFCFFFFSLFFIFRFDDLRDEQIVADRFMYLPSLGFCLWLGIVGEAFIQDSKKLRRYLIIFVLSMFALILFSKTYMQTKIWKDGFSLWSYMVEKNPQLPTAYLNRGNIYNERSQYDLAAKDYAKALELKPNYFESYNNRGIIHFMQGKFSLALEDFNKAIEIKSDYFDAYSNRGNVYSKMGQIELALKDYDKAIAINPDYWKAYVNRGSIYNLQRKYDLALVDYNKALALNPNYADGYLDRGDIYLNLKKSDPALINFNQALKLEPDNGHIYFRRSFAYALQEKYSSALTDALKAQALGAKVDQDYLKELERALGRGSP